MGIEPQVQHHVARRTLDAPTSVRPAMDQVGVLAVAVLGPVLLDRAQPSLLDKLKQPGR